MSSNTRVDSISFLLIFLTRISNYIGSVQHSTFLPASWGEWEREREVTHPKRTAQWSAAADLTVIIRSSHRLARVNGSRCMTNAINPLFFLLASESMSLHADGADSCVIDRMRMELLCLIDHKKNCHNCDFFHSTFSQLHFFECLCWQVQLKYLRFS